MEVISLITSRAGHLEVKQITPGIYRIERDGVDLHGQVTADEVIRWLSHLLHNTEYELSKKPPG